RGLRPIDIARVVLTTEPVPQTVPRRSVAAATSIEALRMPVVISSLSLGSFSITARGKPVRSRMAQTISKSASALTTLSGPPRCSLNTLMSRSLETLDQSATLRVTFWKSSRIAQRYFAMGRPLGGPEGRAAGGLTEGGCPEGSPSGGGD